MIENIKLGPLEGYSALILIAVLAIAVVLIVAVLIASIVKAVKERKDENEDAQEDAFYAEYGVTGENCASTKNSARMRGILNTANAKISLMTSLLKPLRNPNPSRKNLLPKKQRRTSLPCKNPLKNPKRK